MRRRCACSVATPMEEDMSAGLFIARLVFGGLFAAHGSQKLFGWVGGYGLNGTGTFFEVLFFRPGRLFAAGFGLAEGGVGALLAIRLSVHLDAARARHASWATARDAGW